jgi:sigma-B regulation protein RsbU (phosphoserine phosphatase)
VSGDFFDHYKLKSGKTAFCIADVSGKGMNAALMMAKVSSLFHFLGKSIHDPSRLLGMLNREILETSIRGMFVTMITGVYDPGTRNIRLANAGHLPPVMMRGNRMVGAYPAKAPPLGILPGVGYTVDEFQLANDSCLYLFTDGLMDERQPDGGRSDLDGLVDVFARHSRTAPTERLQRIVADIRADECETGDDITILLIED